jgi:AraC family transcriptional regulator, regulatory protein of adaptative response / methylphosphotriester-DNA alkyltransferase methyltransferase
VLQSCAFRGQQPNKIAGHITSCRTISGNVHLHICKFSHLPIIFAFSMHNNTHTSLRQKEIVQTYLQELDQHIAELKQGLAGKALEIADFAAKLHIHPVHLSNTIKEVTGQSTCSLYEERLLAAAKQLLTESNMPIGQVAMQLTYDPSNFTKFFKTYTGLTPKQYRQQQAKMPAKH